MKDEEENKSIDNNETKKSTVVATVRGPLPLDWTRVQPHHSKQADGDEDDDHEHDVIRYPWDVAEIPDDEDEVIVVGTAGQKITRMGLDLGKRCSPGLKKLVLRSHLIRTMEGLSEFKQLELLELYDNMVDKLESLDEGENCAPGPTLRVLDMSYNVIRDMAPVMLCPNLRELCKHVLSEQGMIRSND